MLNTLKRDGYIVKDLDLYLLKFNEDNDRAINVNSPSSVGGCPRARFYGRTGIPQDKGIDSRTRRIFDNGHGVHDRLQRYLTNMGKLLMDEVPVHNKEFEIQGHTDGIIRLSKNELGVLEIKSINDRGFTLLKDAKEEHKQQALIYLFCMESRRQYLRSMIPQHFNYKSMVKEYQSHYQHLKAGEKHSREDKIEFQSQLCFKRDQLLIETPESISKCVLLYENKNNQELKEFTINSRDDYHKQLLITSLEDFAYTSICVENNEVPDRICKNKSDPCGRWCNFKNYCFVV